MARLQNALQAIALRTRYAAERQTALQSLYGHLTQVIDEPDRAVKLQVSPARFPSPKQFRS